jgi:hypothetical protein
MLIIHTVLQLHVTSTLFPNSLSTICFYNAQLLYSPIGESPTQNISSFAYFDMQGSTKKRDNMGPCIQQDEFSFQYFCCLVILLAILICYSPSQVS